MLKEPMYGKYCRTIAAIIISAFFIQDIAWSYPELSLRNHPNNTKLAPASFDKRHTLEDKIATSIVFMIEESHSVPIEKLTLDGVEAVLSKAEEFLVENKVGFLRNGKDITIYVSPNLVLRYTDSDTLLEDLPGFTAGSRANLGVLARHVFTREVEQLELDFITSPSPAKDPEMKKAATTKKPGASYRSNLKKLSRAYDKYTNALRVIRWMRSPDRKYYRARATKRIGSIKSARDKADGEIAMLLEKISAMDWRVYKISDDASNDERLECISLNVREIYIRLQKMMEDGGALSLMANLKSRLKETVVPLLADYLAKEAASSGATGPRRLPGITEFAEPFEKHAEMMIAISKMKRGEDGLISEDGPANGHGAIPVKAKEEIFIIGEKCREMARQLSLLDRPDESKAVSDVGLQLEHNKIVSKLIPAEEFVAVAAEEVARRLAKYQSIMSSNINLVLVQNDKTAEFLTNLAAESGVDWSHVNIIALAGRTSVSPHGTLTFKEFIQKHFKVFPAGNIYDLSDRSIEEYESLLQSKLRPHVAVLGIGANGAVGYNEPGASFENTIHEVKLTGESGHNFTARTLGISEIASALSIFLLARQEDKDITVKALFGPVTTDVPASVLQTENVAENVTVLLSDEPVPAPSPSLWPGPSGGVDLPKRWTEDCREIARDADDKGRIIIAIRGYNVYQNRFTIGADYAFRRMILKPINGNWPDGFEVYYEDKFIGTCYPGNNKLSPVKDTRTLNDKGRFNFDKVRYALDINGKAGYSGEEIILRPYTGSDWASGFTVELNGVKKVASYDKNANMMTGMYIAEMSATKDTEKLTALHDLFTIESKDKHIKDGTRILLSESLFTDGTDESELVQARIALGSALKSGYIAIMKPEDISMAAMNRNASKDKLAIVLTKEDFDNKEIWNGSDKEASLKSSVLILDDKFVGSNYLYLEGVIGLAQALMANNKQAIRKYYELMSAAMPDDEIMAKLDDDSQNNISFAIKAVLRFRPITRMDPEDLNKKRINMENALIAA